MAITFDDYKPVRNKIRKFNADSIINLAVAKLHDIHGRDFSELRAWRPWDLLLVIKWSLIDGDFVSRLPSPTTQDLGRIMNMIRDLGDQARLPSNHTGFRTLFKSMAFQQFWLQRRISAADLGRQIPLFLELKNKETISELFHQASRGLSLYDFFELSFGVVAHFLSSDKPLALRPTYFDPISDQYPPESIPKFLDLIALDRSQAQAFLKAEDSRVRDFDARLYERTPLTKRPLLRLPNGTLLCYAPQVLFHGFGNLVYDLLKDHSPSKFSEHLGYAFEEYIKIALNHLSIPFINESELKSTFPNSLVVDYLVPLQSVNILVEAKAVELSPQARTTPSPTVVLNHLRSSVLKAIKQGLTTAHRIRTNDSNIANGSAEFFLLVVTFKDLNIGNGEAFLIEEAAEEIEAFAREFSLDRQAMPKENIYFLSVEEFEWLVELCRGNEELLVKILKSSVERDARPETHKFHFEQHLREHSTHLAAPTFATEPFRKVCFNMRGKFHQTDPRRL